MKKLIAKVSILYLAKLYQPGEEIPSNNPSMVQAWLENKAAIWEESYKSTNLENSIRCFAREEISEEEKESDKSFEQDEEESDEEESETSQECRMQDEMNTSKNQISEVEFETETKQASITRRNKK